MALWVSLIQHNLNLVEQYTLGVYTWCVCVMPVGLLPLLLLLFRHSAKNLNVQEERLATSP